MPKLYAKLSNRYLGPLIIASFLLTLLLSGFGLYRIQEELLDRTGQILALAAVDMVEELDRSLSERASDMQVMAQLPVFSGSNLPAMQQHLTSVQESSSAFIHLGFANSQGQVVVATNPALLNHQVHDKSVFQESRKHNTVFIQNTPLADAFDDQMGIVLATPIQKTDGAMSGIIIGYLRVSALERIVARTLSTVLANLGNDRTIEWQILAHNGEVVFDSLLREQGQVNLVQLQLPSALRLLQEGHGYIQEQHRRRDVPVLTGFARTQGLRDELSLHWGVLVRIDQLDVLSSIHSFLLKLSIGGGFFLIPLYSLVFWTTIRLEKEHCEVGKAEKKYRGIFENVQEGIFQTSRDGRFLNANPALARMYGFPSPADLMTHFTNIEQELYVDPERRRQFHQLIEKYGMVEGFEAQIVRADGQIRWISENAYAVRDAHGTLLHYEGTVGDITDRKQAEQERDQFFDLSLDMLCIASTDGYFKRINPAFTQSLGYSTEELLSKPFLDYVYCEDYESTLDALDKLKEGQPVIDFVNRYTARNGSLLWIQWRGIPDPDGRLIFAVARDITEAIAQEEAKSKLEAQMCHSQKMQAIGTLAGGIAHDFNNILTAILGYSELALSSVSETSPTHRQLQEVCTAGKRAKDLVAQILAFSRHHDPERNPVDFHELLDEAVRLVKATLPSTITIRQRSHLQHSMILADSTQIHQVIVNLCTNAAQAMGERGGQLDLFLEEIQVLTSTPALNLVPGAYLRLTVRDSGPGMPSEVLDRIFEPFFTTKNVGEGTGMGLAVVHGIVTNHLGRIIVDSVVGHGTTVEVYLPKLLEIPKPTPVSDMPIPHGQECILYVDDEEALCRLHQEILESLGYEVVPQTSSVEALQMFRHAPGRFDLVMTDHMMPHMTGQDFIRELRKIRPTIPVIVCSGFSDFVPDKATNPLDIQACLFKPVASGELAVTIRQVLDRHQKGGT